LSNAVSVERNWYLICPGTDFLWRLHISLFHLFIFLLCLNRQAALFFGKMECSWRKLHLTQQRLGCWVFADLRRESTYIWVRCELKSACVSRSYLFAYLQCIYLSSTRSRMRTSSVSMRYTVARLIMYIRREGSMIVNTQRDIGAGTSNVPLTRVIVERLRSNNAVQQSTLTYMQKQSFSVST
jgi:hypothetical protein